MAVPVLRPGQSDDAVPRLKRSLVRELVKLGLRPVAERIVVESKTYGSAAVEGVEKFQARKHLQADGVVRKETWRALGIDDPVVDAGPAFEGQVIVAPGANLRNKPIEQITMKYVARMAGLLEKPITITTGTNHRKFTPNGSISDHFFGHAADIGMAANGGAIDSPVGDRIMAAALVLAGVPAVKATAQARRGGTLTFEHDRMHIQCIWKAPDHHDHVHVGVRPAS